MWSGSEELLATTIVCKMKLEVYENKREVGALLSGRLESTDAPLLSSKERSLHESCNTLLLAFSCCRRPAVNSAIVLSGWTTSTFAKGASWPSASYRQPFLIFESFCSYDSFCSWWSRVVSARRAEVKLRKAVLTDCSSGKYSATSGERSARFVPARCAIVFPRTPPFNSDR
jgi:hypothetical protein